MSTSGQPGAEQLPDQPQSITDNRFSQGAVTGDGTRVTQHFHSARRTRAEWPAWYGNPPGPADCLQDRPAQTAELARALAPGGSGEAGGTAVLTSVLSGMGGVGKTQLAADYLRTWRTGPGCEGLAVWCTASSRAAVLTDYSAAALEVAAREDRSAPEDPAARADWFMTWLSATDRPWLVVLDDLADPADLRDLWPEGPRGACLVTTRRTDAVLRQRGRVMVPVGLFSSEESLVYLGQKLAGVAADVPAVFEGAAGLAVDLAHLPLALAQAASFIANYGETCAGYRVRLAARRTTLAELFPAEEAADDYQSTVAATWSISIDAADRLTPAGLARPLLELASLLDPNGIPYDVLISAPALGYLNAVRTPPAPAESGAITEQQGRDALANLARLSLLELDRSSRARAVRVHAMVQRATREKTTQRQVAERAAADALSEAWTEDPHDGTVAQAYRGNALALIDHDPDSMWRPGAHSVLSLAGRSFGEAGQVAAACSHWTRVVDTSLRKLGPDPLDTLAARDLLAGWRGEAGDRAGAVEAFKGLVADFLRVFGAEHPHTLAARHNLARWRGEAGDPAGAAGAFEGLVADYLRVFGTEYPGTLAARHNLAYWRGEAGNPAGAAAALKELLLDAKRVLGPDHPDTLTARRHLALWRGWAGDPASAAATLEELVTDVARVHGADHPHTLTTRANLAYWRGQAGDPAGAAVALEELLIDTERVLGPDHPDTLTTRGHLAGSHGWVGDPTSAAAALEELLSDLVRVLGPDHPDTLTARHNSAHWRGQSGDPASAIAVLEELVSDLVRVFGADHHDTLTTRHNLAGWRAEAGDLASAAAEFEALLGDRLRVLGPDHPNTAITRRNLAIWRARAMRLS